jgi:hypothetical protein
MTTESPNAEMAAVAWVKQVPGVDPTKVATTLPRDVDAWAATGFVTVSGVGGSPNVHVAMRRPVVSISAWAVTPNSEKAPWGRAQALAERVFAAFYDPEMFPHRVTFPESVDFYPASIRTGHPLAEPRKVPGSEAGYAQVQFDATFAWVTVR